MLITEVEIHAAPTELIVDNADSGYSESGSGWNNSSSTDEYKGQSRYTYDNGTAARWEASVSGGTYQVSTRWTCLKSNGSLHFRDTRADYNVYNADGTQLLNVEKNQRLNCGQWNLLDTVSFQAGVVAVELVGDAEHNGAISADAVRLTSSEAVGDPGSGTPSQPLSYAEGGPAVEDPGQGQTHVHYVDARDGNDANDGLNPTRAWRSLRKVTTEASRLPAGTHVLFRRGHTFTGGKFRFENNRRGREGQRLVLGAYGPLNEARPRLLRSISIRNCAYLTVRDFDTEGIGISQAADHILIYNNVVHAIESPRLNNGIAVNDRAHHIAIVSNLVYDIHQNDAISIHDKNWEPNPAPVGSAHWVIDNVLIGNRGMEEPIDVASGHGFIPMAQDIKIIGNRVSCPAVSGVSQLSGRANGGIVAMHDASHLWMMGNTVTGCGNRGIGLLANGADTRMGVQITGNVLYNNGRNNNVNFDLDISEMHVTHNTILHDVNTRNPIAIREDARRVTFSSNLVGVKEHNSAGWISVHPSPAVALTNMDNNWYADLAGSLSAVIDHRTLIRWQADTGFDVNAGEGVVPGVSIPGTPWADPHRWNDQAYLALFTPSASFIRCAGANTPGAFDCQGNRLGMTIRPSPGLSENTGLGWPGPAIVQRRYPLP